MRAIADPVEHSRTWVGTSIEIHATAEPGADGEALTRHLEAILASARVEAAIRVLPHDPARDRFATIRRASADADVVVTAMRAPGTRRARTAMRTTSVLLGSKKIPAQLGKLC